MDSGAATHEEIWDDSALVDSWNDALEEYKKYHSIHAKGGTVDDIVDAHLTPNGAAVTRRDANASAKPETDDAEEGEVDETAPMDESDETWHPTISDGQGSVDAKKADEAAAAAAAPGEGFGPQTMLGAVQDEGLKKLLMSWYYAGYYTGLFEGKQQGLEQAAQARKGQ